MKFTPIFYGSSPDLPAVPPFPASVPGNIQLDYITAHPEVAGDLNYGLEHRKMLPLEPYTWLYTAALDYALNPGEKLWFVTEGIDYLWSLLLDGEEFYTHEGMFSRVELCLTDLLGDRLHPGAAFAVKIHPHPMLPGRPRHRSQAAQCVKPPVAYEWDWHPRVIPSGVWDETYFETRTDAHIFDAEARYTLTDDLTRADVTVSVRAACPARVTFRSPAGEVVFAGRTTPDQPELCFSVEDPVLWWCRGMGDPALYTYEVTTDGDRRTGTVGFRRVKLVMNEGAWREPAGFPKSRSNPPAQIELNGVKVFAKGSNYVNQEIFTGTMTREKYEETVRAAVECHMNIFRCWGGSGVQKEDFYDLCDRWGIMLWVEFPLACNEYYDSEHYLRTLEQEASAIIRKIRRHPSLVLWCGGNELFNSWSGMTEQYLALRLLDKLTFEMSPEIPFNMTSPLSGMKHGGYTFIDRETGLDPYALFGQAKATAYTEFGVPGIASAERIREIIPADELFPPKPGPDSAWEAHHAFGAWGSDAWLCWSTLERFGDVSSLDAMAETSAWLQRTGYKAIFEAARRQKPACAMAINWCWCEPWKCAVNNSLIAYPNLRKDAYYAVADSLRDTLGAAQIPKFLWAPGETMTLVPWLLNDTREPVKGRVTLSVAIGGEEFPLGTAVLEAKPNTNAEGAPLTFTIPATAAQKQRFTVTAALETEEGEIVTNTYELVVEGGSKIKVDG
ncbi:MAG: hypothetical protein IK082_03125 [Oscillospiraceae bacterium]|nr:hypothetical protein [Oscillospiraceae bacterium]